MKYILKNISEKKEFTNFIKIKNSDKLLNESIVHWDNLIGETLDFSYNGIIGELLVTKIDNSRIFFTIDDIEYSTTKKTFLKVGFSKIFSIKYYKYNIGEIISGKQILNIEYLKNGKSKEIIYTYKCLIDGYIGTMSEYNLSILKHGCPVCANEITLVGYNDIATTAPWMEKYFVNKEDAKKYKQTSNKIINMICPICGTKKKMCISNLYNQGFSCNCNNKASFSEKYFFIFLSYYNIEFITQASKNTFSWAGKYRYDFYIPKYNMIVETHGAQHYKEVKNSFFDYNKIKKYDEEKEKLAKSNGIKYYIVLDCSRSNVEYIKNSILSSIIFDIFSIEKSNVPWYSFVDSVNQNMILKICNYKMNNPHMSNKQIYEETGIRVSVVAEYLKIGKKYGWYTRTDEEEKWLKEFRKENFCSIENNVFLNIIDLSNQSQELYNDFFPNNTITYAIKRNGVMREKYKINKISAIDYLFGNPKIPYFVSDNTLELLKKYYTEGVS